MSSQPPPPSFAPASQQQPLLHHQYVAMVHVYQRIFISSIVLPVSVIVIPILLRIVYRFLKLCIIGLSKSDNHSTDDVLVVSSIVTTVLFTHLFTTKFLYLQSWLHYLATYNTVEEHNLSSSQVKDDGDHSTTSQVDNETSKENSRSDNNDESDTFEQLNSKGGDHGEIIVSKKTPLKESCHQNSGSIGTNDTATTTKNETASAQPQQQIPKKSPRASNEQNHTQPIMNPHTSNSIPTTTSGSKSATMYIFIFVFLFICTLTRYLDPNARSRHTHTSSSRTLPDYLLPSFITTIRFSFCMLVYAFMMALRFFGPASISK